jgi:hypothetical protein
MDRYVRQEDIYSSGPIALHNLLIWSKCDHQLSLEQLDRLCRCSLKCGTSTRFFHETIQCILNLTNLKLVKMILYPDINELVRHLNYGDSIILKYHTDVDRISSEHYVFIPKIEDDMFVLINDDNMVANYPIIEKVNFQRVEKYLIPREYEPSDKQVDIFDREYPYAWIFSVK